MKALKFFTSIISLLALSYYGWKLFANPNGNKYAFDKYHNIYFKGDSLNETNAKDLAQYLKDQEYFTGEEESAVQISKTTSTKDTVNLKFVVDKTKLTPDIEKVFLKMGNMIPEKIFNGAPIIVYLADSELDDIKILGYTKSAKNEKAVITQSESLANVDPAAQLAPKYKEVIANNKVFYSDASATKLDVIIDYLSSASFFKQGRKLSIVFDKKDKGYFLMLPFSEKYLSNEKFLENVKQMGDDIQRKFFPDEEFTMFACDLDFKPVISYVSNLK